MSEIQSRIKDAAGPVSPGAVFIRFSNKSRPLSGCIAGDIFYVFVNGDVAVCPYLVFATENPAAKHHRVEFIVGDLFDDSGNIASKLDAYKLHERYSVGATPSCAGCSANASCGKGCPAAVIASGAIGDVDAEVCPSPAAVQCS